jgi:DNA-binding transcriptional regulator YdaS (Cro superfamily)
MTKFALRAYRIVLSSETVLIIASVISASVNPDQISPACEPNRSAKAVRWIDVSGATSRCDESSTESQIGNRLPDGAVRR